MSDRFTKEKIVSELFVTSYTRKTTFYRQNRSLFELNTVGTGATQLVYTSHYEVELGEMLYYVLETIFNYLTLPECFKLTVPDGHSRSIDTITRN